jgi:mannose-6-phosphate isomerase-like protein (cupin superfamily)
MAEGPSSRSEHYTPERCYIVALAGANAEAECSIARARVEPGVTTQLHSLHGIAERYVILSGEGRMEVGGEQIPVNPSDVVLIPDGVAQRITNTGSEDLTFLCICIPPFRTESYVNLES